MRKFLDGLIFSILALYILAGVRIAPIHGDESTILALSRDVFTIAQSRAAELYYHEPPLGDPAFQELRVLNGQLYPLSYGVLALLAGFQAVDLPQQWDWGAAYDFNVATGHLARPDVLYFARIWATWGLILSVAVLYRVARKLIRRRGAWVGAWVAAVIYVLLPAVLLNGRRANHEGWMLATLIAVLAVGLQLVQASPRLASSRFKAIYGELWRWGSFGLVCGLAVASKHNNAFVVIIVTGSVLCFAKGNFVRRLAGLSIAAVFGAVIFIAFNPIWWNMPLQAPSVMYRQRVALLAGQTQAFERYADGVAGIAARMQALVTFPLGPAQYFEASPQWETWIGDQIRVYAASPFAGISLSLPLLMVLALVGAVGFWVLPLTRAGFAFHICFVALLLSTLILTPIPWQRYYLPLTSFWAVALGAGLQQISTRILPRRT